MAYPYLIWKEIFLCFPMRKSHFTWSPDGKFLASVENVEYDGDDIYTIRLIDIEGHTVLHTFQATAISETCYLYLSKILWAPDARRLAFIEGFTWRGCGEDGCRGPCADAYAKLTYDRRVLRK